MPTNNISSPPKASTPTDVIIQRIDEPRSWEDTCVMMGFFSGDSQTIALRNTLIGYNSGATLTTSTDNVVIGAHALESGTTDSLNTIMGTYAGQYLNTGLSNVIIGYEAGKGSDGVSTYDNAILIGYQAGHDLTTASGATIIGYQAGEKNLTGANETFLGYHAGRYITGGENISIGYRSGFGADGSSTCQQSVFMGNYAGEAITSGDWNVCLGNHSGRDINTAGNNTVIGSKAGFTLTTGSNNVIIGCDAAYESAVTIASCIILGYGAGRDEDSSNRLIIDNQDRGSAEATRTNAILYGVMAATPAAQSLSINAALTTSQSLASTPDEITATSEGVAASVATVNTEVTTNGDSDLDNVTLANGASGQIKHIYCVAEGNAADTWKITPANMVGGTQITFSGVGEGCTLVYADDEGWVVVANNGGTIT